MTLVISNYNYVPDYLQPYMKKLGYVLYDQSSDAEIKDEIGTKFKNTISSNHTDHNLSDYCDYIIKNYKSPPKIIRFVKGNIVPRHTEKVFFDKNIAKEEFFPLFNKSETSSNFRICGNVGNNLYYEYNDPWYCQSKPPKYFHSYDDFMSFCFSDYYPQRYIIFNPGACQIVLREQILRYPIQFWKNLKFICAYQFFPAEAFIIERAFFSIFMGSYSLSGNMIADFKKNFALEGRQQKVYMEVKNYRTLRSRLRGNF